ncbi:ATP-binding protein [Chamaesiphon sp. OTE_75_metabat_556]|uniref:ATP-binding protein n=1 Tax=Chamaesiphon sp. OTE_75_metabat_556 TaxID=2964692 RepID=UPI00286B1AFB|nr:ATP-binding protein [Chamaesiphon sp. OTE_75_metabat_556]
MPESRGMDAPDRSRTILIVEDDAICRQVLCGYLHQDTRYTYTILETDTGTAGLEQYQMAQPDAILLDYLLPDMDGLEFLQALQAQINKPDLPVVLLTGSDRADLAELAIDSGAQSYLSKLDLTAENLRLSLHSAIKQGELLRQVATLTTQNDRQLAVLQQQESQLRLALKSAQMGIWDWDLTIDRIHWNREQELLFGLQPGSFDGSCAFFCRCIHPEDLDTVREYIGQSTEQRGGFCHQFRIIWPNGNIHWIEVRGETYFDATGQAIRMMGTVANIDDRQQAQQLLQDRLEQQRLVMDLTLQIRRSLDLHEILQTTVNEVRQFLQTDRVIVYEFSPDWSGTVIVESVGAGWTPLLGTQIYVSLIESFLAGFHQGLPVAYGDVRNADVAQWYLQLLENLQIRANLLVPIFKGDDLWGLLVAHYCAAPRQWQPSEIELVDRLASQVSIAIQQADLFARAQTELTQRKQAELNLQLLNAELAQRQSVEQLKDEFIGIVSHELRTPLTSMRGALGLLAMGVLDDEPAQMKRTIEIAAIETERLVRMVNDILDLEKLAAGGDTHAPEWCNALEIVERASEVMSGRAKADRVTIEVDCPAVEIWVLPDRLMQIFTNLLDNALKFSPPGSTVSIVATLIDNTMPGNLTQADSEPLSANSPAHSIQFAITDRGRGIPEDKLETIFNRFQQVDTSDARDQGGTGLGLAICKSIALQHQGQIWVESKWGHGSTFFVTLPQPMAKTRSN